MLRILHWFCISGGLREIVHKESYSKMTNFFCVKIVFLIISGVQVCSSKTFVDVDYNNFNEDDLVSNEDENSTLLQTIFAHVAKIKRETGHGMINKKGEFSSENIQSFQGEFWKLMKIMENIVMIFLWKLGEIYCVIY